MVDTQDEDDAFLDRLLDHTEVPILFGLEEAPSQGARHYPRWERRVFVKLKETVGEPVQDQRLEELEQQPEGLVQAVDLPPEIQPEHARMWMASHLTKSG